MKYYESLERNLETLRREFPSFLQKNNDYTHGKVVGIRDANANPNLVRGFCVGEECAGKDKMAMGIMFHGTHRDSVTPICTEGINEFSCFTNSFHYAVRRAQLKQNYEGDAQVLAMAVLVEKEDRLGGKDIGLRSPCRSHALPLFIVTVRDH